MNERRGAVGADQLDAAVEEQIAEQRRKDADIGEAQQGSRRRTTMVRPLAISMTIAREQQHRAAAHADGEKRQRMDGRPLAQIAA